MRLVDVRFTECDIAGAWVIDQISIEDARGRFARAWCLAEFEDHGLRFVPVQANLIYSTRAGTVRGLHFQAPPALEAKLVRCTRGAIFDVVVDLRPWSTSYRRWYGTELGADNGRMLYVPEHCAHGFQSLEDGSEVYYLTSAFYAPESVRGVRFDDPAIAIPWPMAASAISDQDRNWPPLEGAEEW